MELFQPRLSMSKYGNITFRFSFKIAQNLLFEIFYDRFGFSDNYYPILMFSLNSINTISLEFEDWVHGNDIYKYLDKSTNADILDILNTWIKYQAQTLLEYQESLLLKDIECLKNKYNYIENPNMDLRLNMFK